METLAEIASGWELDNEWRPVPGFPNYAVSATGQVKGPRAMLKQGVTNGYHHVSLVRDGAISTHKVQALVVAAFLGQAPFAGAHSAHNDGDRSNNRVTNLRWATATENQSDRVRHGTDLRGVSVYGAKLTDDAVREIRGRLADGENQSHIAADFDVSNSTICLINKNRIWAHVE